jgi:regulatory protein
VSSRNTRAPHEASGARGGTGADASRILARRPRTERELRDALAGRGHVAEAIDETVRALQEAGVLNDAGLALHYILTRTERLGHGRERLLRELEERGVDAAIAASAWRLAEERYGVDSAALLARQVARRTADLDGRLDRRAYRRVYNALLRAGFEAHSVRRELEPYRAFNHTAEEFDDDGVCDDLR